MNIESTSRKIIDSIKIWQQDNKSLVVGIDGYSGSGKTTLLRYISERYDFVEPVFMDDFVSTANTKEQLLPQIENNSQDLKLEWAPVDGIDIVKNIIHEFTLKNREGKVLIVEGIFLFHKDVLFNNLDKIVYIDIDKKVADDRRVKREKERWQEKYFPETHPDSFARLFTIAFKRYEELYSPKQRADLCINV